MGSTEYGRVEKGSVFSYTLTPRLPASALARCISETHDFGRLGNHIEAGGDLLPRVVFCHEFPAAAGGGVGRPLSAFPDMRSAKIFLTTTSRGGAVLVIDGELEEYTASGIGDIPELLAAACFARHEIMVEDQPIMEWTMARLKEAGLSVDDLGFGSDVHQCVFLSGAPEAMLPGTGDTAPASQMATRILYRGTVPAGSGARLGIYLPDRLNSPGSTFVAHGRGVSLFSGWSLHLENAFALTTISTVSALEALRLSRHEVFAAMALSQNSAGASAKDARELVSQLSDRLNEMQLDLSFGVEAHTDSILIPEMIVEAFQSSLNSAVQIRESLDNTSRMLQRVDAVISARLAKLQAGDRERTERRDRVVAILVAIASLLALPPALLLAFFGANASNVHARESIFDLHAYWGAYILAWLPFVLLVAAGWILHSRLRRHQV